MELSHRNERSYVVYSCSIFYNDMDVDVYMEWRMNKYGWYPDGATLCSSCYSVCSLVYKDADKSIYECIKCKRETIVNHEESDW